MRKKFFCLMLSVFFFSLGIDPVQATIFKITDNNMDDSYPSLYENKIAFGSYNDTSHGTSSGIYLWDGIGTTQISTSGYTPSYENNTMAWIESIGDHEIYYWDGNTIIPITNDIFQDMQVSQNDGTIAWTQFGWNWSGSKIMYWDGLTTRQISQEGAWASRYPSLYGGTIAWQGQIEPSDKDQIYFWDGSTTTKITDNGSVNNIFPSLYNGTISWVGGNSIMYWDGTTINNIATYASNPWFPVLYNGTIAWSASDGNDSEIFFWDGTNIIQITDNNWEDSYPSLYAGMIAWSGEDGQDEEIFFWDGGTLDLAYDTGDGNDTSPVPEPPTMLLLGSGLVGLAGFRKRFLKK